MSEVALKKDKGKVRMTLVDMKSFNKLHRNYFSDEFIIEDIMSHYSDLLEWFESGSKQNMTAVLETIFDELLEHDNKFDNIYSMAELYEYGITMHFFESWKYIEAGRWVDALGRHLKAIDSGEEFDSESELSHRSHAAWNCMTIYNILVNGVKEMKTNES